jgi:ribosomal protein L11 methylase PrmA
MLLLSGLLNTDEHSMSSELLSHGFVIREVCRENEWLAIAVTLPA